MSRILTTDKLVLSVKRRSMLPTDQVTFTKQDLIDILNEEIDQGLLPHLLSTHEEYLVRYLDQVLASGTLAYRIPYRAIGNKLRGAAFVDGNGSVFKLTRVMLEDILHFQDTDYQTYSFYVENDQLKLTNSSNAQSYTLRMYYYLRPSTLVENKYGAVVTNIDRTTGQITVNKIPSTFSEGVEYDFTQARTPNKLYNYDIIPTSINTTSKIITFANADVPDELVVGDYITLAEQSIVPQVPTELHPLLAQRAAVHCLEAIGDTEGYKVASEKLKDMEQKTINLIDNRVESAPQKINHFDSPLGQTNRKFRRSY